VDYHGKSDKQKLEEIKTILDKWNVPKPDNSLLIEKTLTGLTWLVFGSIALYLCVQDEVGIRLIQ
jgi:hypothetical protein